MTEHRDYVNMRTGELGTFDDHVTWIEERALARGKRGASTGSVFFCDEFYGSAYCKHVMDPLVIAALFMASQPLVEERSEAWARGELELQITKTKAWGKMDYRCDACGEVYFFIESAIQCRDGHVKDTLEMKISLPSATVRQIESLIKDNLIMGEREFDLGEVGTADPPRDAGATPVSSTVMGGSGIIIGSQHSRDCVDESCRYIDPVSTIDGMLSWCGACENGRFSSYCRTCGRTWIGENELL